MDSEKKSKALARGINPFILLPSAFILYLPFPLIRLPKKRRKGRNQKAEGRRQKPNKFWEQELETSARGIIPFILLPSAFILYLPFPLIQLPKKRRKGRNQKAEGRRQKNCLDVRA